MVDHDAAILNDLDIRFAQSSRRLTVMDAELHPDRARLRLESQDLVDVRRDVFRGTKEVDDVDRGPTRFVRRVRQLGEARVGAFVEHALELGIDRNDPVAALLQVVRNPVGVLVRIALDPDDGDRPGVPEQAGQMLVAQRRSLGGPTAVTGPPAFERVCHDPPP